MCWVVCCGFGSTRTGHIGLASGYLNASPTACTLLQLSSTAAQVTYIMACAELYFSSLCGLMQERKALHEALVAADGGLSECTRRLLGLDGTVDQLTLLDRWAASCVFTLLVAVDWLQ